MRAWEGGSPGEPAVVDFQKLWESACALAVACGAEAPRPGKPTPSVVDTRKTHARHRAVKRVLKGPVTGRDKEGSGGASKGGAGGDIPPAALELLPGTLPKGPGRRHRALWAAVGKLRWLGAGWTFAGVAAFAREWHRQALAQRLVSGIDGVEVTVVDFLLAFKNRRYPAGRGGTFADAAEAALALAVPPPPEANVLPDGSLRKLVCLVYGLSRLSGDKTFILACRDAATVIGTSHAWANEQLNLLTRWELLKLVKRGVRGPGPTGVANVWKWKGEGAARGPKRPPEGPPGFQGQGRAAGGEGEEVAAPGRAGQ